MSEANEIRSRKKGLNDSNNKQTDQNDQSKSKQSTVYTISYESFHKTRSSLLSSASGYTNYRGILNLCVVLLVMSSGRLVLENIIKYGFLVRFDVPVLFLKDPTAWPSLLIIVCSNIFALFGLYIENLLDKNNITENMGKFLCVINIFSALLIPAIYLWYNEANPVSAFFALAIYTCLSMKLVSYFQVNRYYRLKKKNALKLNENETNNNTVKANNNNNVDLSRFNSVNKSLSQLEDVKVNRNEDNEKLKESLNEKLINYPDNLTIKNLYYFLAAPTLCYEINFPRTERIRKSFLIRRSSEILFLSGLQLILIQQWVIPILRNSKIPFRETDILKIIERLLKLAVPNHVLWLIGFYCFFHSYLNVLAELLRFGDREFYRDWWNAEDVNVFWQNWNIPVHNFCLRHIYKPLLVQGISKSQASIIVFFISAFFHEYLVSIPLRMFRLWSFLGMMIQIPFALIVKKFLHGNYGNMAVWISLIIGQPIAIMMYIHDFYIDYFKHATD